MCVCIYFVAFICSLLWHFQLTRYACFHLLDLFQFNGSFVSFFFRCCIFRMKQSIKWMRYAFLFWTENSLLLLIEQRQQKLNSIKNLIDSLCFVGSFETSPSQVGSSDDLKLVVNNTNLLHVKIHAILRTAPCVYPLKREI